MGFHVWIHSAGEVQLHALGITEDKPCSNRSSNFRHRLRDDGWRFPQDIRNKFNIIITVKVMVRHRNRADRPKPTRTPQALRTADSS